ncbi:ubiquitin-like small modifier protein SAMP2 [Natrarchaeobius oligotrophus]|uniref:MoaD/ThiS family protein n=1 Tax=Natrarchaeobius chitinivorans TaxID=1679083 RepID=A0A3N6N005_NATCH|nr:ubiquitin-like small modifier protein 2 [Natrarchaeobius chitinivorans]RQH00757.1 hypothetical protein EA472_08945 [Natrarchaeobius chitinivorans]
MRVTVDVKGEDTYEFDLEALEEGAGTVDRSGCATDASSPDGDESDAGGAMPTYADLLRKIDLSPHEVSVVVDGRPVPEDQPVETDHVTVLRLITGG